MPYTKMVSAADLRGRNKSSFSIETMDDKNRNHRQENILIGSTVVIICSEFLEQLRIYGRREEPKRSPFNTCFVKLSNQQASSGRAAHKAEAIYLKREHLGRGGLLVHPSLGK